MDISEKSVHWNYWSGFRAKREGRLHWNRRIGKSSRSLRGHPQIHELLDLLLVPSRWEGFGLILIEAMGIPIVATNMGAIPEFIIPGETALLVPSSSPQTLAEKAIFLLTHPEQAKKLGEKGRERAKEFSWEFAGTLLGNLYTE